MNDQIPRGPGAYDSDPDEEFLVKHDADIRAEAWRIFLSGRFPVDTFDFDLNELTQTMRIRLWKACQKQVIDNPRAYIRKIASTAAVDLVRHHKPSVYLSAALNGEPGPDNSRLAQTGILLQDPAHEIELEEIESTLLSKLVEPILGLPPRQKQAMLCSLKEHQNDVPALIQALKDKGIDFETLYWPEEEHEKRLLKASLSVARKKLRGLLSD